MAYSYIRPPMYGTETNRSCMKFMLGAPTIYCVFAAWMFSNEQVFLNEIIVNDSDQYLFPTTDHQIKDFFSYRTPGDIFLVWLIIITVYNYGPFVVDKVYEVFTGKKVFGKSKIEMNQNLEPFNDSLSKKQINAIYREEEVIRNKFGFSRLF